MREMLGARLHVELSNPILISYERKFESKWK